MDRLAYQEEETPAWYGSLMETNFKKNLDYPNPSTCPSRVPVFYKIYGSRIGT